MRKKSECPINALHIPPGYENESRLFFLRKHLARHFFADFTPAAGRKFYAIAKAVKKCFGSPLAFGRPGCASEGGMRSMLPQR